jgi:uncharacterized membrane protein
MMITRTGRTHLHALSVLLLVAGCSSDGGSDHETGEVEGKETGSVCPPNSTVTYDEFVKPFMQDFCVRCHSSTLKDDARNGAPLGHDFDTEAGVRVVGHHVDENAAAGPDAVNTIMPPSDPKPSEEKRRMLGEWLACNPPPDGTPEM